MIILRKVGLAVIKDRKLLMVRDDKNPERFSTLGGKFEDGEDDIACLTREVKEEVGAQVDQESLSYFGEFEGDVVGRPNTRVNIRLYSGALIGEPKPNSEIVELKYFDSQIPVIHLTPASKLIFEYLKAHNMID